MATCKLCGKYPVSRSLLICGDCIKNLSGPELEELILKTHKQSRYPLPATPPKESGGVTCFLCPNRCCIELGKRGFCGLKENRDNRLAVIAGDSRKGLVTWYHDPLPTNCVADWVCPAGSQSGYPDYSYTPNKECGYTNLAVFFGGCSFDCLFCQNRSYHAMAVEPSELHTPEELVDAITERTACLCFFGGDPSPQMPFALEVCRLAIRKKRGRILRLCWETNGNIHETFIDEMAELSLISGGCIKFDLKAINENLHRTLSGVSNKKTMDNFAYLAKFIPKRPDPPFLVASTLLVPGYVGVEEVAGIARFLAQLDPDIPYTLLAFFPHHFFRDLPLMSWKEAEQCRETALQVGLKRVRLGNVHLLK
ncbi:MAG: radical SAM protein [Syntrophales bacterium]|nr:radical SAM protein [Syntrophales bacterium]